MLFQRRKSVLVASIVLCLAFVTAATASVMTGWHGLSQTQRNRLILARANRDLGRDMNMQCKEWVRLVVKDASQNEVAIPSTRANNYEWNNHRYVTSYPRACPPRGIVPGHIIQMVWTNQSNGVTNPHTAIILSSTSSGMTWIDCNWQRDEVVRTHYVSYSQFEVCVGYLYTIYKIR